MVEKGMKVDQKRIKSGVKQEIPLPKSLPGSVHKQWVRCGKAGCRCSDPKKLHGPYYYRIYREFRQIRKEYIKRENVKKVRQLCANYRKERQESRQFLAYLNLLMRFVQSNRRKPPKKMSQSPLFGIMTGRNRK